MEPCCSLPQYIHIPLCNLARRSILRTRHKSQMQCYQGMAYSSSTALGFHHEKRRRNRCYLRGFDKLPYPPHLWVNQRQYWMAVLMQWQQHWSAAMTMNLCPPAGQSELDSHIPLCRCCILLYHRSISFDNLDLSHLRCGTWKVPFVGYFDTRTSGKALRLHIPFRQIDTLHKILLDPRADGKIDRTHIHHWRYIESIRVVRQPPALLLHFHCSPDCPIASRDKFDQCMVFPQYNSFRLGTHQQHILLDMEWPSFQRNLGGAQQINVQIWFLVGYQINHKNTHRQFVITSSQLYPQNRFVGSSSSTGGYVGRTVGGGDTG